VAPQQAAVVNQSVATVDEVAWVKIVLGIVPTDGTGAASSRKQKLR
jgi:hypothetical protein